MVINSTLLKITQSIPYHQHPRRCEYKGRSRAQFYSNPFPYPHARQDHNSRWSWVKQRCVVLYSQCFSSADLFWNRLTHWWLTKDICHANLEVFKLWKLTNNFTMHKMTAFQLVIFYFETQKVLDKVPRLRCCNLISFWYHDIIFVNKERERKKTTMLWLFWKVTSPFHHSISVIGLSRRDHCLLGRNCPKIVKISSKTILFYPKRRFLTDKSFPVFMTFFLPFFLVFYFFLFLLIFYFPLITSKMSNSCTYRFLSSSLSDTQQNRFYYYKLFEEFLVCLFQCIGNIHWL